MTWIGVVRGLIHILSGQVLFPHLVHNLVPDVSGSKSGFHGKAFRQ